MYMVAAVMLIWPAMVTPSRIRNETPLGSTVYLHNSLNAQHAMVCYNLFGLLVIHYQISGRA